MLCLKILSSTLEKGKMCKNSIGIKTDKEIEIMKEGGRVLGAIKTELMDKVKEGATAYEVEETAEKLIAKAGGEPSFKMVPGYRWATCVNLNGGIVHGIPRRKTVFKMGDVVSVDVGMFFKGFHTDTAFTVGVKTNKKTNPFINLGRQVLRDAIEKARYGNRIYDISFVIEEKIKEAGFSPIRALVGHGIGRDLHEFPQIPCFTQGKKGERDNSPEIPLNSALAIEVMYAQGKPNVVLDSDRWTISMRDGKISALFEDTVAVTKEGSLVITEAN